MRRKSPGPVKIGRSASSWVTGSTGQTRSGRCSTPRPKRTSLTVVDACEPLPGSASTKTERVSMVAVGAALALLGAADSDLKINLLPKSVAEARSLSRHLVATATVGVIRVSRYLRHRAASGANDQRDGPEDRANQAGGGALRHAGAHCRREIPGPGNRAPPAARWSRCASPEGREATGLAGHSRCRPTSRAGRCIGHAVAVQRRPNSCR